MIAAWLVVIEYKLHTARTCRVANPFRTSNPRGIAPSRKSRCNSAMGGPSRRRIFGDRVPGARISAEHAREQTRAAARQADAAECLLWSEQMEGFGGPARPSPTIAQCLNGGYGWLEVMCHRCPTRSSLPLDAIRRLRDQAHATARDHALRVGAPGRR
jgi:hypothetical protein